MPRADGQPGSHRTEPQRSHRTPTFMRGDLGKVRPRLHVGSLGKVLEGRGLLIELSGHRGLLCALSDCSLSRGAPSRPLDVATVSMELCGEEGVPGGVELGCCVDGQVTGGPGPLPGRNPGQ